MGTVHAKEAEAASSGPVSLQSVNAQVTKVRVRCVSLLHFDTIDLQLANSSNFVSLSRPCNLLQVFVDGVERTKEDIILSQVKPIFKAAHFEELLLKAQDARNNLQGKPSGRPCGNFSLSILLA